MGLDLLPRYRVLELPGEGGLLCGRTLSLMGADVIKIEPPGGDPVRNRGPFYHDVPSPDRSLYWLYFNEGKRGITLNLEKPEGRDIFRNLVKKADVVIESFAPGYLKGLGLDYAALRKINPSLVMCSITPFGQEGPYSRFKATDLVGMALGGMVRVYGEEGRPCRISFPLFYSLGSLHAAAAIALALYNRNLTGEGQYIDVSCQEAVSASLLNTLELWRFYRVNYKGSGVFVKSMRKGLPPLLLRRVWRCRDGYVLLLWGGGQRGIETSSRNLIAWAAEEGFATEIKDYDWSKWDSATMPQEEADRLERNIAQFLETKTKEELLREALKRHILLAPVNSIREIAENPHFRARGFFETISVPEWETSFICPGLPIKIDEPLYRETGRAPFPGEHNLEIYQEELGIPRQDLDFLKSTGVI